MGISRIPKMANVRAQRPITMEWLTRYTRASKSLSSNWFLSNSRRQSQDIGELVTSSRWYTLWLEIWFYLDEFSRVSKNEYFTFHQVFIHLPISTYDDSHNFRLERILREFDYAAKIQLVKSSTTWHSVNKFFKSLKLQFSPSLLQDTGNWKTLSMLILAGPV